MKKFKFELDTTKNIFAVIIIYTVRFFVVPISLFQKYFIKFHIKKTSRFYKLVNYPLVDFVFKYLIIGIIVCYLLFIALLKYGIDVETSLIYTGIFTLVVFLYFILKILFISVVSIISFIIQIAQSVFYTLASLFTEKEYL